MPSCFVPLRILLVDDDSLTLHAMSRLLRMRGYEVDAAGTAAEALAAAEAGTHFVVITDMGLPDATGESLMRELRSLSGYVGIAITGHDDDARRRAAREQGFIGYFLKPVRLDDLLTAVDAVAARVTAAAGSPIPAGTPARA